MAVPHEMCAAREGHDKRIVISGNKWIVVSGNKRTVISGRWIMNGQLSGNERTILSDNKINEQLYLIGG
jgi:hypothetical protein